MDKMSVGEWQRRLEQTFAVDLDVQGLLWWVRKQETEFTSEVETRLRGHVALIDAWHAYYAQTLHHALDNQPEGEGEPSYWGPIITEHLTAFRDFRAAEVAFRSGYPLAGYRILRDLKDRVLFLAAIVADLTSWSALHGLAGEPTKPVDQRKAAMAEEKRVLGLMIRKESGLTDATKEWLGRWERLFHKEVHGSKLSWVALLAPWKEGTPHPLGPQFEEQGGSAYTNRACEVSWMWLRVLPYLQLEPEGYGDEWKSKWHILDDSFLFMETGLREIGKPEIVNAILELMGTKFPYDPTLSYVDRRPGSTSI